MLSEQDKQEMLADAHDLKRRASFRKGRELQAKRQMTLLEYCSFCDDMAKLSPLRSSCAKPVQGHDFRL